MKSLEGAVRRRWWIECAAGTQGGLGIGGLDWGGDGPIALLHHANGFCAATLAPLAQRLKSHYRVIAIDARGQGDSDEPTFSGDLQWAHSAEDLASVAHRLLDETGQDRIGYAIGSSFGGTVSAIAEARHPGTFARIAMLDPPVHFGEERMKEMGITPADLARRAPNLIELAKKRRRIWPSRDVVREAWREKPTFGTWTQEAFDLYLNEGFKDLPDGSIALKCSPAMEAAVFEASGTDPGLFGCVVEVTSPTLLVHAGRGHFPPRVHRHFASLFPNCVFRVANAGHLMPFEDPDLCADILLNFAGRRPIVVRQLMDNSHIFRGLAP